LDHGDFDEVGGGALDGHVDGVAFGGGADGGVGGAEVGEITAASGDGFDVAAFTGAGDGVGHVVFDAGVLGEVAVDERLGVGTRDAKPLGESEGGDAVADAVVDHFSLVALGFGDLSKRQSEDFGSGGAVDVFAAGERFEESGVLSECGKNAEFDLRVVGGEESVFLVARDESAADFATRNGADGDVLQVGVLRVEAACGGRELIEGGVDAAIDRRDGSGQSGDVGGEEFTGFAMFEDLFDDGVERREGGERLFVGGVLTGLGFLGVFHQRQFAEEEFTQLFGRGDVEGGSGVLVDGGFEPDDFGPQFFTDVFQRSGVEADAFVFHGGEDGKKR